MAKCDLEIEVEAPAVAGGTLNGSVLTRARERIETKGLKLWVGWQTRGRGDRDGVVVHEQILHEGELSGEHRFHFTVPLPTGPVSYHGQNLTVEWYAAASVDLEWALDPKSARLFPLVPGCTKDPYVHGNRMPRLGPIMGPLSGFFGVLPAVNARKPFPPPVTRRGVSFVLLSLIVGLGPFLFISASEGGPVLMVFSAVVLSLPVFAFLLSWLSHVIARRLGPVEMFVSETRPAPGETVTVSIQMTPPMRLDLNEVTAALTGTERTVTRPEHGRNGTEQEILYHTFFGEMISLSAGARRLEANEPIAFTGQLTIPSDAPPSFISEFNSVLWEIELHVELPNYPDWTGTISLAVPPRKREPETGG